MGVCCPPPEPTDPNSIRFGDLILKLTPSLASVNLDTIIIITNASMEFDPF